VKAWFPPRAHGPKCRYSRYRVGGKTVPPKRPGPAVTSRGYVASFNRHAPINDPEIVALIIIDEPQGYPYQGGQIAAPVFKAVAEETLRYLGVVSQYTYGEEKTQGLQRSRNSFRCLRWSIYPRMKRPRF
jgi:cell division protein FtsI/penicillin-binding protein 2